MEDFGIKLENVSLDMLGSVAFASSARMHLFENASIVDSAGKKKEIEARIRQIKQQIEDTTSETRPPAIIRIWLRQGIIDPTKVVRTALQDAASGAGLVITWKRSSQASRTGLPLMPRPRPQAWTKRR